MNSLAPPKEPLPRPLAPPRPTCRAGGGILKGSPPPSSNMAARGSPGNAGRGGRGPAPGQGKGKLKAGDRASGTRNGSRSWAPPRTPGKTGCPNGSPGRGSGGSGQLGSPGDGAQGQDTPAGLGCSDRARSVSEQTNAARQCIHAKPKGEGRGGAYHRSAGYVSLDVLLAPRLRKDARVMRTREMMCTARIDARYTSHADGKARTRLMRGRRALCCPHRRA